MTNLVSNLAEAILKSEKSISEISRKSGITRPMLYKIIKKEVSTISTNTIESICKAIQINPSSLYSNSEEISPENTARPNTIVFRSWRRKKRI